MQIITEYWLYYETRGFPQTTILHFYRSTYQICCDHKKGETVQRAVGLSELRTDLEHTQGHAH